LVASQSKIHNFLLIFMQDSGNYPAIVAKLQIGGIKNGTIQTGV